MPRVEIQVLIKRSDIPDYVIDANCVAAPHEIVRLLRVLARAVEVLHSDGGA